MTILHTRDQAIEDSWCIDTNPVYLASIRVDAGRTYLACRTRMEATWWFNANRGWYYDGSEEVEVITR